MQSLNGLNDFYSMLNSETSKSILLSVTDFIKTQFPQLLERTQNLTEISNYYQDYISKITKDFAKVNSIDLSNDKNFYEIIINGFEKVLCSFLYTKMTNLFPKQYLHCSKLFFVSLTDLGIDESKINKNELSVQLNFFIRISNFTSPKDKLFLLTNLCQYINFNIANFDKVKLTKILVYLFIHSEIENLKSQFMLCSYFRHKTVINSKEDYYLTLAIHAIDFALKLNNKNVGMSLEEFNRKQNEIYPNEILKLEEKNFHLDNLETLLNLPIDKLYNEYFKLDIKDVTYEQFEKMRNEFKIILKLIESYKK